MAYPYEVKKSKQLHTDLFILVGSYISRDTESVWEKFKTKAADYLKPADIASAKYASDILRSMESKAYIGEGDYGKLIELLDKAELDDIAKKVREKAAEITAQIQLETGGTKAYQTNDGNIA